MSLLFQNISSHTIKKIHLVAILSILIALPFVLNAQNIDTQNIKIQWEAYKTKDKVAVGGTFNNPVFKFSKKKDKANGIKGALEGASVTLDPKQVELNDDIKNANVRDFFFAKMVKPEIKVTLRDVTEGNNKGTILANVRMNNKTQKVPMTYEITNGVLKAQGLLDLTEFKMEDALKSLNKAVPEHDKLTWSQVKICFEAPIKK